MLVYLRVIHLVPCLNSISRVLKRRCSHGLSHHPPEASAAGTPQVTYLGRTVDGRNPAPVDMENSPLFTGFHPRWCRMSSINSMVAWFFHGHEKWSNGRNGWSLGIQYTSQQWGIMSDLFRLSSKEVRLSWNPSRFCYTLENQHVETKRHPIEQENHLNHPPQWLWGSRNVDFLGYTTPAISPTLGRFCRIKKSQSWQVNEGANRGSFFVVSSRFLYVHPFGLMTLRWPIGSMGLVYSSTFGWFLLVVHVGRYTIHGSLLWLRLF